MTDAFRERVLEGLGTFPGTGDPAPEVLETATLDGYARHLIEYGVEPDERIRAYLLVPDGAADAPGVLAIHQHAGQYFLGKSEPAGLSANDEYHYGAHLVERGYVVLCPDQLCFEERRPPEYRRREGTSPDDGDYERFEAMDRLLRGSTLQAKYLSDLAVGLDVLGGRSEVDADRLGALGHSLGGQEALWIAWYDDRVDAAVSSCGASRYAAIQREGILHNYAAYVPGFLAAGDTDDLLSGIAPTPLLITNGREDGIFPIDAVEAMADATEEVYADAGHPERFRSIVFPGGHGFPGDVRGEAYDFLDRWLR